MERGEKREAGGDVMERRGKRREDRHAGVTRTGQERQSKAE